MPNYKGYGGEMYAVLNINGTVCFHLDSSLNLTSVKNIVILECPVFMTAKQEKEENTTCLYSLAKG